MFNLTKYICEDRDGNGDGHRRMVIWQRLLFLLLCGLHGDGGGGIGLPLDEMGELPDGCMELCVMSGFYS